MAVIAKVQHVNYDDVGGSDLEHEVNFWDLPDAEELNYRSLDEAIENVLDGSEQRDGELLLAGFRSLTLGEHEPDPDRILEDVLEDLDEEYGDFLTGQGTQPTEPMKLAAQAFVGVVRSEYRPWACEAIVHVSVPVREWIEKNNPEWLDDSTDSSTPDGGPAYTADDPPKWINKHRHGGPGD